jgi:hypothetical protein
MIAQKLQEASAMMGSQAMEMYRLNVLERIGREEGSQIVVYGLGGADAQMETMLAATSAGSMVRGSENIGKASNAAQPTPPQGKPSGQ